VGLHRLGRHEQVLGDAQVADPVGRPQSLLQLVKVANGGFTASGSPGVRFAFVRVPAGG